MPQPMPQQQPMPRPQGQAVTPQVAGGYQVPRLTPPTRAAAPQPQAAPRVARGVPRSDNAAIPTPEELGISAKATEAALDWSATRRRMSELGVTRFQLDHQSSGVRFSCWVGARMVQADGVSEAEAVRRCLEQVRQ